MSAGSDGGPAFPLTWHPDMGCSPRSMPEGMSLRDYFAGQALTGLLMEIGTAPEGSYTAGLRRSIALESFHLADALLRAREGGAP